MSDVPVDQAIAVFFMALTTMTAPIIEAVSGHKKACIAAGLSDDSADIAALEYHSMLIRWLEQQMVTALATGGQK